MSDTMTNEAYICKYFGIDGHIDVGLLPNDCYRDIVIIGNDRLLIDINRNFLDYEESPAQKRFEILKKQIQKWKSELPLKNKSVLIDENHV